MVVSDSPSELDLSIVVPCLDEEKTLGSVIEKALALLERLAIRGEVVVADNGSRDGSIGLAEKKGARVVRVSERGYGSALRHGMADSRGRWLLFADADDTYDLGEADRFVSKLREGADLVMGTRLPPGTILPGANPWLNRAVGTPVLTAILNRLFGTRIHDCNCGMRALTRNAFDKLDLKSEGMEFASEIIIKAALCDLAIAEVPVTLHLDRRGRPPHLRRWRDGWRHLEFMLLHAPDQLLFRPGVLLVVLGAFMILPVSFGPLILWGRLFDFHFLFYGGALVLIGLQGVFGALTARAVVKGVVIRPAPLATWLSRSLTFGRGLAVAGILFFAGAAFEAVVLAIWFNRHFGPLNEPRLCVLGMLTLSVGAELAVFSFVHAVLRKHLT
jgi:glycosyltransferase involved in cell wall biosynthesis